MALSSNQEFAIALLTALGAREVLAYVIRRVKYRSEISAAAGKVKAETKSIEVATLSGLVQRLDGKVIALEISLDTALKEKYDCQKANRELLDRLAEAERENQKFKFAARNA